MKGASETPAPQRIGALLESVTPLGGRVLEIQLRLDRSPVGVQAGHYLLLHHPDGPVPFSLASPPRALPAVTLQYQGAGGSDDARRVDALLAAGGRIEVELPFGECGFSAPLQRPLLIVAGGTGISQARALLLELLDTAQAPIRLYWGVGRADDLYLADELDALARAGHDFRWHAAVEADDALEFAARAARANVRRGRVGDLVISDLASGELSLTGQDVLLCGGPPMVWGTVALLRAHGLTESQCRSDVFGYAPRDDLWG